MPHFPRPRHLFYFVLFHRLRSRWLILFLSLVAAVFGLAGPFFQKEFVDALLGHEGLWHWRVGPLLLILFAFLCLISAQALTQICNFLSQRESIKMQRELAKLIYQKTLELKPDATYDKPVGEVVALYATDVPGATILLDQTLPSGASTFFPFLLAPFALSTLLDLPIFSTLIFMAVISCLNLAMAFRQSRFFFLFKQLAAERVGLVNEWVQNLRNIRILGWTEEIENKIILKRQDETNNRIQMVTNGQVMNSISSSITFFLNILGLLSLLYLSRRTPTPGELLALLWILGVFLVRPFRQMPWFCTFAFDSWTSIKRIHHFLVTPNSKPKPGSATRSLGPNTALAVKNLSLKIADREILRNLSLDVNEGELFAIVGEVGSGKSLLLLSLLGETGAQMEEFQIFGRGVETLTPTKWKSFFAFVPQEGFIMSASLRENVVFEYDVKAGHDQAILKSLQLSSFDLLKERVERGLDTVIGERGVNLSGGQRQRVSLARSHHFSASIVLLDDCFSALDVTTEDHILEQLLFGEWKKKTKILVTHRLRVLPKCDRILFLNDGEMVAQGTFDELFKNCETFRTYVETAADDRTDDRANEKVEGKGGKSDGVLA